MSRGLMHCHTPHRASPGACTSAFETAAAGAAPPDAHALTGWPAGDPPVRIDYVWTSGAPAECTLYTDTCADGTSLSDHMGVRAVVDFGTKTEAVEKRLGQLRAADDEALVLAASIISTGARVVLTAVHRNSLSLFAEVVKKPHLARVCVCM